MLRCNLGEPGPAQVVAFDRNASGVIVTLGRVVGTGERGVQNMFAIDPQRNGSIRVQVGDHGGCCNYPEDWIQRQWRTYSFGNGQFRQTGGPTSFGPHPQSADLRISVTDVTVVDGSDPTTQRATVKVTIRNTGPRDVDEVHLNLYTVGGSMLDATGTGWSSCTGRDGRGAKDPTCVFGPLRAGQQRTMVLGIGYLKQSVGDTAMATVRRVDHAPDRNENDNFTRFSLR
ncbi:hypothetical protein AB0M79_10645 [Polymorphospora sp. NPDC051019]|uniref:hypothetical protein n=1 Tax=Polymorphospora sp. NPDC051019 TaxID=3155725 RepID=UPI0034210823